MGFKKTYVVATAKTPKDLEGVYKDIKAHAPDYGFATVGALKSVVVQKAMTDAKKPADFMVQVQLIEKKGLFLDLLCDVKGTMSTVLSRSQIKSMAEYKKAKKLASYSDLNKQVGEIIPGLNI